MSDLELTTAELDAIQELRRSYGWELVVGRIAQCIDRTRFELEVEEDPTKAAKLRGQAAAYRTALRIPEIYCDEITAAIKEQETAHAEGR